MPAEVRRKVFARGAAPRRCQYPGCDRDIFLNLCHRKPHARGGSREAENLLLLCPVHHALLDAGWIRAEGAAARPEFYERLRTEFGTGWRRVENVRAPAGGRNGTDAFRPPG